MSLRLRSLLLFSTPMPSRARAARLILCARSAHFCVRGMQRVRLATVPPMVRHGPQGGGNPARNPHIGMMAAIYGVGIAYLALAARLATGTGIPV